MDHEVESNIKSLDEFRRNRRSRGRPITDRDLEIEVGRLEDVARFLLRRDDHWATVVSQLQRDVNYLLNVKED
jgi:hypothetical protein